MSLLIFRFDVLFVDFIVKYFNYQTTYKKNATHSPSITQNNYDPRPVVTKTLSTPALNKYHVMKERQSQSVLGIGIHQVYKGHHSIHKITI